MSKLLLVSKALKAPRWKDDPAVRDLIAALPIVIFAKALREAFYGPRQARRSTPGRSAVHRSSTQAG